MNALTRKSSEFRVALSELAQAFERDYSPLWMVPRRLRRTSMLNDSMSGSRYREIAFNYCQGVACLWDGRLGFRSDCCEVGGLN